jgi:Tol biopolymer transport system component
VLDARSDQYEFPRLSPDTRQLAVGNNDGAEANIWTYGLDGKADRRRVTVGGRNRFPVWSPDGSRIAFQSDREGDRGIFWQAADGSGTAERLTTAAAGSSHVPAAWTRDNDLLFEVSTEGRYSVQVLSLRTRRTSPLLAESSLAPFTPTLSPDGRWLAYHRQDTVDAATTQRPRRDSVWIRPYPITRDVFEVSSEGTSHHPLWLDGGRRLLYIIGAGQVVARDITLASSPQLGPARPLNSLVMPTQPPGEEARTFDVLGDGRLLSIANASGVPGVAATATIEVVQNWFAELRAKGIGR